MNYQDHVTLEEAYGKVVAKEQLLEESTVEEGLFDRVKSKVGGISKAVGSNLGDAGSYAKKAFKGEWDAPDKKGRDEADTIWNKSKESFKSGSSSSLIKIHVKKLNRAIDDFISDLEKASGATGESSANYGQISDFLKGIIGKIAKTSGRGQVSVSGLKDTLGKAGFLASDQPESSED